MIYKPSDIAALLKKKVQNELTKNEWDRLKDWIRESEHNREVFNELTNADELQVALRELFAFKKAK